MRYVQRAARSMQLCWFSRGGRGAYTYVMRVCCAHLDVTRTPLTPACPLPQVSLSLSGDRTCSTRARDLLTPRLWPG